MTTADDIKLLFAEFPKDAISWRAQSVTKDGTKAMALFFAKVSVDDVTGCWRWSGSTNRLGYGNFWLKGKCWKAHRVSYFFCFGEFDLNLDVLHKCDNRGCVNPHHLFLGTHSENMRDMWAKGRGNPRHGEHNVKAKLTADQVAEIRLSSETSTDLAERFNISRSQVRRIVRGGKGGWTNA